ncbi:hypothetical protein BS112_07025 [Corynebacterium diphtheriae]|nr:hypothetical protein BS112_07025 [Corynebacterium diphtheriae]
MAQDTRVLGFVGIRVSKPSIQNQGPTVQPNGNIIVIAAGPVEPINECPTCGSCLRARQSKDH